MALQNHDILLLGYIISQFVIFEKNLTQTYDEKNGMKDGDISFWGFLSSKLYFWWLAPLIDLFSMWSSEKNIFTWAIFFFLLRSESVKLLIYKV